jgi:hypothetical protein
MTDALAFPWHAGSGQQGMESVFEVVSREFDRCRGPLPDSLLRDPSTNYGIYNLYIYIYIYVCIHLSIYIYIYYTCTHVCIELYIHTPTQTHAFSY